MIDCWQKNKGESEKMMPSRVQELEDRIAELEEENSILISKLEDIGGKL